MPASLLPHLVHYSLTSPGHVLFPLLNIDTGLFSLFWVCMWNFAMPASVLLYFARYSSTSRSQALILPPLLNIATDSTSFYIVCEWNFVMPSSALSFFAKYYSVFLPSFGLHLFI
jgi:hypothetical protein